MEDWFQVENFKKCIPYSSWPECELRVEQNTHRILDLFDSTICTRIPDSSDPGSFRRIMPKATFFVLGWIGERLPSLVREIQTRGHEVASHGYAHNLCSEIQGDAVKRDLEDSKKLLEDTIGGPVYGYRAPSFSISADVLKIVEACGYLYDSSVNSFAAHGRYGQLDLSAYPRNGVAARISDSFYEIPISNLKFGKHVIPWGGGGYFRLMPFFLFKSGVRSILKREGTYLFYLHPWEVDPDQPKVRKVSLAYRFRHYVNIRLCLDRLRLLIAGHGDSRFVTCHEYIQEMSNVIHM